MSDTTHNAPDNVVPLASAATAETRTLAGRPVKLGKLLPFHLTWAGRAYSRAYKAGVLAQWEQWRDEYTARQSVVIDITDDADMDAKLPLVIGNDPTFAAARQDSAAREVQAAIAAGERYVTLSVASVVIPEEKVIMEFLLGQVYEDIENDLLETVVVLTTDGATLRQHHRARTLQTYLDERLNELLFDASPEEIRDTVKWVFSELRPVLEERFQSMKGAATADPTTAPAGPETTDPS